MSKFEQEDGYLSKEGKNLPMQAAFVAFVCKDHVTSCKDVTHCFPSPLLAMKLKFNDLKVSIMQTNKASRFHKEIPTPEQKLKTGARR